MKEPHIKNMDAFRVVGVKLRTTHENMRGLKDVPDFWSRLIQNNAQFQILQLMSKHPKGLLGISVNNVDPNDPRVYDYYIACSSSFSTPMGMVEYTVPAATWAIFPCKEACMGQAQERINSQWISASGYYTLNSGHEIGDMLSGIPDIERYNDEGIVEVWSPVEITQDR